LLNPLFLQPHVFLSRGKRHWVIMDVSRDKYLCIDREQFEALGPWLHGWEETRTPPDRSAAAPCDAAIALSEKLLSLEILSERADEVKSAQPIAYPSPTEAMDPDDVAARSRLFRYAYAPDFFWSSARASRQLRNHPFRSVVTVVGGRKRAKRNGPLDIERARSLVAVFDSLRLFYPRSYQCLFDSLALIHFLARFALYPDWVFGVTAEPFEAHCWVQSGNVVLNDTVERVSAFTPIMYV
jgi:Transglutaminase-like superfamily